jgi:hypothetical protein
MNISTLRTRVEGSTTAFGATALNERSQLVTDGVEKRSSLTETQATPPSHAELHPGEPDPLIQALVDRLPQSDSIWSIDERAKWLKAAAMVFNLIYKTE